MKRASLSLVFAVTILAQNISVAENVLPPEVEALRKLILERDYPELFKNQPYRTRIENILVADIDGDGRKDLIVHFSPDFRQSATIVIYQVSSKLEVVRVTEGLAPGPMKAVTGEFLDSHVLGMAVDFDIGDKQNDAVAKSKVLKTALSKFGGVVAYRNFFHADNRTGKSAYIDMTHIDFSPATKNCESFEFSKVRQIAAGNSKSDKARNYLAAWVDDEIYVYLIRSISKEGLLDKQLLVKKVPPGFDGFLPGEGLTYRTASGRREIMDVEI